MAELLALRHLLNGPADRVIARQQDQTLTLQDLQLRVLQWIVALQSSDGQRWAVYHEDSFEFLAILQALWQLNRTACIPGDNLPGTVLRLIDCVDGFVGEFALPSNVSCDITVGSLAAPTWVVPAVDFPALEIYTSGSTGQPKSITKTFQQLHREVETLEAQWPSQAGSVVLATVSHQHFYGMTFRLLWPLASARSFQRTLCEYTEDVFHQALAYDAFSLVSSPSHLGRMNTSVNWQDLAGCCEYVISSAAPLSRADSLQVGTLLSAPVREIYGSSETGAVGWRCQQLNNQEANWWPLPGIILSAHAEDGVYLNSPYLEPGKAFDLPDRINLSADGSFQLQGRLDSIVKVEGKRISLLEIERLLLESSLIKQAKALTLERNRIEIAVLIELTEEGEERLQTADRKQLIKAFKSQLSEHFEAVLLPRRWRFVTQMPYNPQGKLPMETLRSMFEKETIKWPEIVSEQLQENQLLIECDIPAELIYFDGHFEGNPILPGIVQVHWAEAFGRRSLSLQGQFTRLEAIKFKQIIMPSSRITLALDYDEAKQKLSFEYRSERGVHSSGRICFA